MNNKIFISNLKAFKQKAYSLADTFDTCICLDSNENLAACGYGEYQFMAAFGVKEELLLDSHQQAFDKLHEFYEKYKQWLFGYLGYDLKNDVEKLSSENEDKLGLPKLYFFVPQHIILVKGNEAEIISENASEILKQLENIQVSTTDKSSQSIKFTPKINRENYLEKVERIRQHIEEGDVYEMNLCMEFFAENAEIDPMVVCQHLVEVSPMPFAAYLKIKNTFHALCASPERFLMKQGNKLVSQPIKGTIKRGADEKEDLALKQQLYTSEKERAENVMIVDLVRNDLGRSAKAGTVKVEELFGIYGFPQVYQMVSTVTAEMKEGSNWAATLRNAFPMGSMTGAPKVKVMELTERYEESRRGLFSGAIGYIDPDENFDFNVVIRTLQYHSSKKILSYQVGSAITYDSVPEQEYEECLLKASAILKVLGGKN